MAKKFWQSAPSNWKEQAELNDRLRQQQMEETAFGADTGTPSSLSQMLRTGRVLPSQPAQNRPRFQGPSPTPGGSGFTVSRPQQGGQKPLLTDPRQVDKKILQAPEQLVRGGLSNIVRTGLPQQQGVSVSSGREMSFNTGTPEEEAAARAEAVRRLGGDPALAYGPQTGAEQAGSMLAGFGGFLGPAISPEEMAKNPLIGLGPEAQIAGDIALKAAGPVARQIGQGVKGYPKKLIETMPRIVPERQVMGLAKKVTPTARLAKKYGTVPVEGRQIAEFLGANGEIIRRPSGLGVHSEFVKAAGVPEVEAYKSGLVRIRPGVERNNAKSLAVQSVGTLNEKQLASLQKYYPDYKVYWDVGFGDTPRQSYEFKTMDEFIGKARAVPPAAKAGQAKPSTVAAPIAESFGARKATAEGMARVEAAKQALRDVLNNPDLVGRQRADAIENGKQLVAFLESKADTRKPMETAIFKGDKVAFTGVTTPEGHREFIYLEGAKAGDYGVRPVPKVQQPQAPLSKAEPPQTLPNERIPDEAPSIEGVGFPQRETPLTVEGAGERPIRQGPPKGPIEPPTTGAAVPQEGFAANIRLSKYPEETRGLIKEWADAHPNEVQAARRGVRSDTQVLADAEALVDDLGGSFQKLQKKWSPGEAWNAEELLAIRGTLRSKTEAVLTAQAATKTSGNSAKSLIDLELALREQALVQEMVHGVTAEAGRALRSFRQLAFEAKDDAAKLEKLLEMLGGRDKLGDIAQKIGQLDVNNPASVNAFIRSVTKPKMSDYLIELFYNSILSGPKTHIVNSASNTLVALLSPVERGVAGIVDAPIALLQGRARQRFAREAFVDIYGALQGLPEGLQSALYTMKHGISPAQATKWEFRQKAFKGVLGRIINTPSTALEAADVMMRQINYRASINAEAYRLARMEGKTGFAAMPRVAELLANPTKELMERSAKVAEYRLFRQEPGKFAAWLMTGRDTVTPFGIPVLRFVIPFIRTPVNLIKFGLERSPAGFLNPSLWRHLAKSSPEAAEEIARAAIGSLVAGTVALYVAQEKITGAAPTSAAQRDQFYREGKQPYSVLVGDRWVSYQRVEPFNQVLSQVAAVVNAIAQEDKSADQMALQVVNTIGQNFVSQTYMSSISDLIEGIQQPGVSGGRLITRLITSVAPPFSAASRTAAQMVDPTIRQPSDIVEQAQANIPGLSRNVPARIDVFGEDIERQSAAWLPISVTQSKGSGLDKELKRLGVTIGFVGNTIREIELSDAQHNEYKRLAGQFTKRNLEETLADPLYEKKSDVEKERVLNSAISDARNEARGIILSQRDDAASKTMGKEYLGRIKAERQLKPYFDIPDQVMAQMGNKKVKLDSGGFTTVKMYMELTDQLEQQAEKAAKKVPPDLVTRDKYLVAAKARKAGNVYKAVSAEVTRLKNEYRKAHPEADALLYTWYGLTPKWKYQQKATPQTVVPTQSLATAGTLVR